MQWSFVYFDPTLVSALTRSMLTEPEIWGILLLRITSFLISNRFQDAGAVIQCCSEDVICSKWHSRHWSGTWFQAQFLNNRLGIFQNGSKPTSQMAPFTANHWQFSEFLNECGEILSGTDVVLPDLVFVVFLGSCTNFRYLGWVLSICPCINKFWEGDAWGGL